MMNSMASSKLTTEYTVTNSLIYYDTTLTNVVAAGSYVEC